MAVLAAGGTEMLVAATNKGQYEVGSFSFTVACTIGGWENQVADKQPFSVCVYIFIEIISNNCDAE